MVKFLEKIDNLIHLHLERFGTRPTGLYMGRDQKHEMLQWLINEPYRNMPHRSATTWEGTKRPELLGCKIYLVNSKDHLAIA